MKQIRSFLILGPAFLVLLVFLPVLTNKPMGYSVHPMETSVLTKMFRSLSPFDFFDGGYGGCGGDQGNVSSTKAGMQNLKTALVNFQNDLGKMPFTGIAMSSGSVFLANQECLGDPINKNVLVSSSVATPFESLGIASATYAKRWKGPYMDSDPAEFMLDAWESRILYLYWDKKLWLHSAGPDGVRDPIDQASSASYAGDDIVMCVTRLRKSLL